MSLVALLLSVSLSACLAKSDSEETVGVSMTGLDHLAEHLSVQDFWVDGHHAHQAGKGGRQVCCASLPAKWRPGLTVKVRWGVTNWRDRVYSMHEKVVQVDRYETAGALRVHFLVDGSVRVLAVDDYPEKPGYPGPPYSTVLRKQPWKDYPRPEGMKEFPQVENAMKDHRK